jgi:hypothetical protein
MTPARRSEGGAAWPRWQDPIARGYAVTEAVDAARERIGRRIFATWDPHDSMRWYG